MRTIICGSRTVSQSDVFQAMTAYGQLPTVVISGKARGADTYGEDWAAAHQIPVEGYPADWRAHGKAAGYIRNSQMLDVAEAVVAVWDGASRGTLDTIKKAQERGLPVYVHRTDLKSNFVSSE